MRPIANFMKIITKIKYVNNKEIIIKIVITWNVMKIRLLLLCSYILIFVRLFCVMVKENELIN